MALLVPTTRPSLALTVNVYVPALFAGAFETVDDAAHLAQMARAAGVATTLVYRTGATR